MWLITGGAYQDKLAFAMSVIGMNKPFVANGAECSLDELCAADVVDNYNQYVKRALEADRDIYADTERLMAENPDGVIIMDEVGCGIVPIQAEDRRYRETNGRISCLIAAKATRVYRVVCGIGGLIKGDQDLSD